MTVQDGRDETGRPIAPAGERGILSTEVVGGYGLAVGAVLAYFVFRLFCYASWFHPYVPPDEVDLFARVRLFRQVLGIPADTAETAVLGILAHRPFLYFWLMARWMELNVFAIDDLIFVRYGNIPIALVTAVYAYRCSGFFTQSRPARLLSLVAVTNTLQLSTLSGTVTYDNAVTCLGVVAAYYLFVLFERIDLGALLKFLLALALGCLSKISFAPLAGVYAAALVVRRRRTLLQDARAIASALRKPSRAQLGLTVALLIAVSFTAEMYVGNLIRYGGSDPYGEAIFSTMPREHALRNRITRRDWSVRQFRAGKLTYEQAAAEIAKIDNGGNRARGMYMLDLARDHKKFEASIVSRETYAFVWTRIMMERLIGFQGNSQHVVMPSMGMRYAVVLMMLCCLVMFIRRARVDDERGVPVYAFWICFAYAMLLMWTVTYPIYREFGVIDNTVNGRYLLPLLPLLYGVGVRYGVAVWPRGVQIALATVVGALFVWSDLPHLLGHMKPCWFADVDAATRCVY